ADDVSPSRGLSGAEPPLQWRTRRMRRRLFGGVISALMFTLAMTSVSLGAASHARVTVLDACDGPSFNAVIGPGTCERSGGVKFDAFIGQLITMGEAPASSFAPATPNLAEGASVYA